MQFTRSLIAATRPGDFSFSRCLPAARTPSRRLRTSGKAFFHPFFTKADERCESLTKTATTCVSSVKTPSKHFFSPPVWPARSPLSVVRTGEQASTRVPLCAEAVKKRNDRTVTQIPQFTQVSVMCRLAQQTATLSTTSTTSTTASSSSSSPAAAGSGNALATGVRTGEESNDDGSAHLRSKLDELVNSTAVVLFMKGSPHAPQCGFSARAVALLEAIDIADYTFINILKNPEVRAVAKEHFGWPTYPLLIVGGEVVGGVDIMEELSKTGQLRRDIQNAVEKYRKTQTG